MKLAVELSKIRRREELSTAAAEELSTTEEPL
jgi:hypothetical protein